MTGSSFPRITIWAYSCNPEYEATAKEIMMLHDSFDHVWVHSLSDTKLLCSDKRAVSYHSKLYPVRAVVVPILEARSQISHIYVSHPERFYVSMLRRNPTLVTYCGRIHPKIPGVKAFVVALRRADHIVVESSEDLRYLGELGLGLDRLSLIYPGVDLSKHHCTEVSESLKILFASSPLAERQDIFDGRGVELVLRSLKYLPECSFVLLWRGRCMRALHRLLRRLDIDRSRLVIMNGVVSDVPRLLAQVHSVIAPYTRIEGNKACPNSLVEGLASGRPALASRLVGIADLIEKEECGVVFEPTTEGLVRGVETLRRNYEYYRSNSRRVAEKLFSKDSFIERYRQLYRSLTKE